MPAKTLSQASLCHPLQPMNHDRKRHERSQQDLEQLQSLDQDGTDLLTHEESLAQHPIVTNRRNLAKNWLNQAQC